MAGDINLSKNAKARLENRTDRAYERIEKRVDEKDQAQAKADKKEKLERRAQWWQGVRDSLKEQGQEFLNYWTYDIDKEQKEEEKPSTNIGGTTTNTTTGNLNGNQFGLNVPSKEELAIPQDQREIYRRFGVLPNTTATTPSGASVTDTTSDSTHTGAAQRAIRNNAQSYADYAKRVAGGASAYGELMREAIERKNNLAFRKERSARAQAIANALGTLVNTITAGAIAKKNGTIPIIAGHDATADTNLRKSIENRYAMENESEKLLMQLVNSRIAHEKELAKAQLDADVKNNELLYKSASEDLKAAAKKEEAEATREWRTQITQNNADLKRELAKAKPTRVVINNSGGKEVPYDKDSFKNSIYRTKSGRPELGGEVEAGKKGTLFNRFKKARLTDEQWDDAIAFVNSQWTNNEKYLEGNIGDIAAAAIQYAKTKK